MSAARTLVLAWGNPSRGDDALGPALLDALAAEFDPTAVECLGDFQLQIEHALDLRDRARVLFVDASLDAAAPFSVSTVQPARDASFSSHSLSPAAVLQVYLDVVGSAPPPCTLLAIRGERFELGEPLGEAAQQHLALALGWCRHWLA